MEKVLAELYQQLQKLLSLHRQLLELLRTEKQALVDADVTKIEELALSKQGLLDQIAFHDELRRKLIVQLSPGGGDAITLSKVAIIAQGIQVKLGEQFRSV